MCRGRERLQSNKRQNGGETVGMRKEKRGGRRDGEQNRVS